MIGLHSLIVSLIVAAPATDPATDHRVHIEKKVATVTRTVFDPSHRPKDMPSLQGREAALTRYDFQCSIRVDYDLAETVKSGSSKNVHIVARLQRIDLVLSLNDQIFIPENANIPLRSHEEGHRAIDQRVYDTAETAARAAAAEAMEKTWPGDGANEDDAGRAATDAAVKAIGDSYLKLTAQRAGRISDRYDVITQHGTRPVNVAHAVDQAFEEDDHAISDKVPTAASKPSIAR